MNIILTNFGHRFINQQLNILSETELLQNRQTNLLLQILKQKTLNITINNFYKNLIDTGYIEIVENLDIKAIDFKYQKNPLQHVDRIVFEFTTFCNFNCSHCRNGFTEKITETDIEKLKAVADVFKTLNINRFDFIGGEVSKYGNNWLELVKHINKNNDKIVTLFSNGWWLEKTDFEAAGKFYKNDFDYLTDLKQNGLTHILFSIDGDEEYHDKSRNQKGLYNRILTSFERIKKIGLKPRITALLIENQNSKILKTFAHISTLIYDLPSDWDLKSKAEKLLNDPTNQFSNFIDIGNGVKLKKNRIKINTIPSKYLICKAFYRPSPSLRISANGNLSVCPLLDAGEDYGNIKEQNIVEILNNFHNSFAYKLHANKEIKQYLKYLDPNIFGEYVDHICSLRTILTLMAKYINEEKVLDNETILKINKKIAKYSGHEK